MLPWRVQHDPYRVLVSELMLQQTQVERVIPKFVAFLDAFPTVHALAVAQQRDVLILWQGLGYNRRARFLHQAAQRIAELGHFPERREELQSLPGVGPYTAGAICAFAYNMPEVFLETNIRAVLIHHFFPRAKKVQDALMLPILAECMQRVKEPRIWYAALMDYGTHLKQTRGNATRKSASYTKQTAFKGSRRQVRGSIVRLLSANMSLSHSEIVKKHPLFERVLIESILLDLIKEGFIAKKKNTYSLA